MRNLYEKYPRLISSLIVLVISGVFYLGKYLLVDRYDASRFSQFTFKRDMADSGKYVSPEHFSRPHNHEDLYGCRMVLEVKPGAPKEDKKVFWYPSAEFSGVSKTYKLYSEEPLPEELLERFLRADCLIAGYYSVPTGLSGAVARGNFILEIIKTEELPDDSGTADITISGS